MGDESREEPAFDSGGVGCSAIGDAVADGGNGCGCVVVLVRM